MSIVRFDGHWFHHPYTHGRMPNHPTCYGGLALYIDRRYWVMSVRYRHSSGQMALGNTPRSRWRIVALWHGLMGHTEARP
jgi:hypothetical protein